MKHKKILSFEQIKKEREQFAQMEACGVKRFFIFKFIDYILHIFPLI